MAQLNEAGQWTAACHHEAAHCALATLLDVPIDDVTLGWERRGLFRRIPSGLVRIPDHFTDPAPLALVVAAGALGEARWVERNHDTTLQSAYGVAARLNVDDAAALAQYLRDGDLNHQDVLDEALRLVDDAWPVVEVLAAEIDATGYLTGRQLQQLARAA